MTKKSSANWISGWNLTWNTKISKRLVFSTSILGLVRVLSSAFTSGLYLWVTFDLIQICTMCSFYVVGDTVWIWKKRVHYFEYLKKSENDPRDVLYTEPQTWKTLVFFKKIQSEKSHDKNASANWIREYNYRMHVIYCALFDPLLSFQMGVYYVVGHSV